MAGLLNLIPRYLPRYGMARNLGPGGATARPHPDRTAFLVTWLFDADVNAQGGAYATGVLVLFTSAGTAVTLAARRAGQRKLTAAFTVITAVFLYTTVDNVVERPDGVKIGACFIAAILTVSLASRLQARLRASRHRRPARRDRLPVHPRLRPAHHPTGRQRARPTRQAEVRREDQADSPRQRPTGRSRHHLRGGHGHGPVGLRDPARRSRPRAARALRVLAQSSSVPTRSRHCCCTCATGRPSPRTSTSNGPKATRCRTSCGSSSSASVRSPRSPARCCGGQSRIATVDPMCTSDDRRTMNP